MTKVYKTITIIALLTIIAVFFIVNQYTFLLSDDYSMNLTNKVGEMCAYIKHFYMTWSGRWFALLMQMVFCGFFASKMAFNIANTLFFISLILLIGANARCERIKNTPPRWHSQPWQP